MRRCRVLAALVGCWLLVAGAAHAQTKDLASPRVALRAFIRAVATADEDPEALAEALACLDLSQLPEERRAEVGRERALQLKRVLQLVKLPPLEAVPDEPKGDPFVLHQDPDGVGVVVLERVSGQWRFSAETLKDAPGLLTVLERRRGERIAAQGPPPTAPAAGATPPATPAGPRYASAAEWLRGHVPPALQGQTFVLEHWQWLGLAALAFLGVLADRLLSFLLLTLILRAFERRGVRADRQATRKGLRPCGLLIMAGVWWAGLSLLGLPGGVLLIVGATVKFVAALAGVWGAYRLVDVGCDALETKAARTTSKFDDLLIPLVRKSAKVFVVCFGLVFVADTLQLSISSLLAGLGLGGLAFALAAQDTVKNLFGSLTVVLDRPFEVGDWVVVEGVEGTVEEVGFRSTRVRTFYNSVVSMPNARLLTAVVDNMGARRYRRWTTRLGVAYDTPPELLEALCEGIRELVRRHPHTRKDYYMVHVNGLGANAIEILIYVFHQVPDWGTELAERQRLILDILRLARGLKVEIAFPTQTLHVLQGSPQARGALPATGDAAAELGRREALALLDPGPTSRTRP